MSGTATASARNTNVTIGELLFVLTLVIVPTPVFVLIPAFVLFLLATSKAALPSFGMGH